MTYNLYTGQEITYADYQAPSLEPLQGVCPAVAAGFPGSEAGSACDNGYILFGSQPNPNGIDFFGIFTGPVSDLVNVSGGPFSGGGVDAVGDIAWTDGALDEDFAAIDLTSVGQVPEPASLPLGYWAVGLYRGFSPSASAVTSLRAQLDGGLTVQPVMA